MKPANDSEASLKLISDWFVTSKMIKNLSAALYADENLLYFNEDSVDAVFLGSIQIGSIGTFSLLRHCDNLTIILW